VPLPLHQSALPPAHNIVFHSVKSIRHHQPSCLCLLATTVSMEPPHPPPRSPMPHSFSPSPRSPPRKRRAGQFSARAVVDHSPAPVIPPNYEPPFFAGVTATPELRDLYTYQCAIDRRHAITNIISLILDTGASISVSNCAADFVTAIRPVQHTTLKGIAAGLAIKGLGTV
jgi:hypothetical protein